MGCKIKCLYFLRQRLLPVLEKLNLPNTLMGNAEALIEACRHDKKMSGKDITIVYVPEIGSFELQKIPFQNMEERIRQVLNG